MPDLLGYRILVVDDEPAMEKGPRVELRRLIYQRSVRPPERYLDKQIDEKCLLAHIGRILSLSSWRTSVKP
jgi:hypothetical protein